MAHVSTTFWGVVLTLDHAETQDVLSVGASVADIVAKIGDFLARTPAAVAGYIIEAIAVGISVNVIVIEQLDQGNGVYITTPWVALGTIVPTTRRSGIGIPSTWVQRGRGTFGTEDPADLVQYRVEPAVVPPDVVEFRLNATWSGMWRKVLVLRDGLGSQWDLAIDPSQGVYSQTNGLWADQVRNGQSLSLWKAKELGLMTWVLDIPHLEQLPAGSRAVFTWLVDR